MRVFHARAHISIILPYLSAACGKLITREEGLLNWVTTLTCWEGEGVVWCWWGDGGGGVMAEGCNMWYIIIHVQAIGMEALLSKTM